MNTEETDHAPVPESGAEGSMTEQDDSTAAAPEGEGGDGTKKKRRRRRRRRGKGGGEGTAEGTSDSGPSGDAGEGSDGASDERTEEGEAVAPKKEGSKPSGKGRRKRPQGSATNAEIFDQEKSFADIGLSGAALKGLERAGFQHPTYIQSQLIPVVLSGKDTLGQAKTGTGKTAAFALPLIDMVKPGEPFQVLVLAPTRELAIQIHKEIEDLGFASEARSLPVYGGQSIRLQADKLAKGPEIIVGTPGRVMDMVGRGYLRFDTIKHVVLDEVDRMLDMGFRDDIRKILKACPADRQTIFVSATIPDEIERLARSYMTDPEKVVTTAGSLTANLVEQHYLTVESWDKKRLLHHLLKHEDPALTLVFCRLKRAVDDLEKYLSRHGIEAFAMHADMPQGKRNAVMTKLRDGELKVVIASDLASRGIDVDGISHVINYDLPEDVELYVHRIGRTARAGQGGIAWAFVTPEQGGLLSSIEDLINAEIPKLEYPDFEPGPVPSDVEAIRERERQRLEQAKSRNRFRVEVPVTAAAEAGPGKDPDPAKFPGGKVPGKLPRKLMGGRVRGRR